MSTALSFLVVEDDGGVERTLVRALSSHGSVESARSYAAARTALRARTFDAIVLDIGLPDGSGFDLLKLARTRMPAACVLVLTGSMEHSVINEVHEHGARYLLKPCDLKQLTVLAEEARTRKNARERRTSLVLDRWRADYDLSPAEVDLLSLGLEGVPREDFSRLRNVRPDTIRKQIQALLRKTGDDTFESAVNSMLREAVAEPT